MKAVVISRYGLVAKVLMTAMLLAGAGFFASMATLVSHDSELRCAADGRCAHVERYPLGVQRTEPVPAFTVAEARWDPGGRVMALRLVLRHPDGSTTEYQGVGKNGARAEETARQLNAFLAHPGGGQVFPLREGSLPVAIFLAACALAGLFLLPHFFTRIRVARAGWAVSITTGRWPAPARSTEVSPELIRFGVRQVNRAAEIFFTVCAERTDRDETLELGTQSRSQKVALARAAELNAWLAESE